MDSRPHRLYQQPAELQPKGGGFWHCVQLYEQVAFLASVVASYAAEGLSSREAVIIVAKDCNRPLFEAELAERGVDLAAVLKSGQLTMLSAEATLRLFMGGGWPDQAAFSESVGGVVRCAAAGGWAGVRAFGEMVAVLWEAGHPAMALQLEQLWEELAETAKFSLLCAYRLESFAGSGLAQSINNTKGFSGVCDSHSLVLPSESYLNLSSEADRLRAVARLQQLLAASVSGSASITDDSVPAVERLKDACLRTRGGKYIAAMRVRLEVGETVDTANFPDQFGERFGRISPLWTREGELTLIAEGLSDFSSAHELAQAVRRTLPDSACMGVDVSIAQNAAAGEILKNAEIALRAAKRKGKGQTEFYSTRMGKSAHLQHQVEAPLRNALERNELAVYFQPEVSLQALETSRFEALVRWFPSADCSVPPSTFIPVAEEAGLIIGIGEWVLREACRRAAGWQAGELQGVGVAVNVSAVQFAEPDFISVVDTILRETGLHPSLLELELTETMVVRDFERSSRKLKRLRKLGVTIAIDDFGTGYSSLSYLQQLPVDALKIDRCFVAELEDSRSRAPVLKGMIGIARELGIRVVVEGIETAEQFNAIASFGCDEAQGYLLGRPAAEPRLWAGPGRSLRELAA